MDIVVISTIHMIVDGHSSNLNGSCSESSCVILHLYRTPRTSAGTLVLDSTLNLDAVMDLGGLECDAWDCGDENKGLFFDLETDKMCPAGDGPPTGGDGDGTVCEASVRACRTIYKDTMAERSIVPTVYDHHITALHKLTLCASRVTRYTLTSSQISQNVAFTRVHVMAGMGHRQARRVQRCCELEIKECSREKRCDICSRQWRRQKWNQSFKKRVSFV